MTERPPLPPGPFLVAGLGRAGCAALAALERAGLGPCAAWDASESAGPSAAARSWRRRGVEVELGGDSTALLDRLGAAATVVKSPGIDAGAPLLERAAEIGAVVVDELELGWRLHPGKLVAVTGTNGKSTTAALTARALGGAEAGVEVVGNTEFGPPLSAAPASAGPLVCEVSSFQLEFSPRFLPEVAVFTNLSLEHLPRHETMERYGEAKARMFVRERGPAELAIVNVDDPFGRDLAARCRDRGGRVIAYGFGADADVRVTSARWTMREATTRLATPAGDLCLRTRLPGAYNALNLAAAAAVGIAAGHDRELVGARLGGAGAPPGRCEVVDRGQPFDLVVDYAHTPDGIRRFLDGARTVAASRGSAVRVVFGAVGLRDPEKARQSGLALGELSDQLLLTTGTAPRDARIPRLLELRDAARVAGARPQLVLDRRAAIAAATAAARPGDIVAVLGLGALSRLILDRAGTAMPFDDREAASAAAEAVA